MQANRAAFEKERPQDAPADHKDDDCEVRKAYADKTHCNVLICSSHTKNSVGIFPIIKEKEDLDNGMGKVKKITKEIRVIQSDEKGRTLESVHDDDDSPLIGAFVCAATEFEENMDAIITVTEKSIKVYDKTMKLMVVLEGFNIRGC